MKILILKESNPNESRVALTPDLIAKYNKLGYEILLENGSGEKSHISDKIYQENGAKIVKDATKEIANANIILKVGAPNEDDFKILENAKKDAILVGALNPYSDTKLAAKYEKIGVKAFAAELFPRISRAQNIDILSSQSNLVGYRAVIDGVYELNSAAPMMMTAAGTVTPAKVMILGAGVAGLQAIATAKRLGAVVSAFDVRAAAKEQVES